MLRTCRRAATWQGELVRATMRAAAHTRRRFHLGVDAIRAPMKQVKSS